MDLAFHRAPDRQQQEAKLGGDMDLFGAHLDLAIDAAALEIESIPVPTAGHIELLRDMVGDPLHRFPCLRQWPRVRAPDIDTWHGGGFRGGPGDRIRPILLGFHVCTKNEERTVC